MAFSCVNRDSLDRVLLKWVAEIHHYCGNVGIVLMATKIDLRSDTNLKNGKAISYKEGEAMARKMGCLSYKETSALTEEGMNTFYEHVIKSAVISKDKLQADPENIYLSRAPRYRIKAELVRDLILSSSGLLIKTIGGPSVKPYQPGGLWENASSGRGILRTYKQDHGSDLYRRGMYTFIKRTVPPPVMGIFDASNRDQCEVIRLKTNTPVQALIMMNDPTVIEASRVLASKLDVEPTQVQDKVIKAFRLIVCRKPSEKEIKLLSTYYNDQLIAFKKEQSRADKLLSIGEYPNPEKMNKLSVAAMMQVITALYNLEETITRS